MRRHGLTSAWICLALRLPLSFFFFSTHTRALTEPPSLHTFTVYKYDFWHPHTSATDIAHAPPRVQKTRPLDLRHLSVWLLAALLAFADEGSNKSAVWGIWGETVGRWDAITGLYSWVLFGWSTVSKGGRKTNSQSKYMSIKEPQIKPESGWSFIDSVLT